jgi:hypothetical protein
VISSGNQVGARPCARLPLARSLPLWPSGMCDRGGLKAWAVHQSVSLVRLSVRLETVSPSQSCWIAFSAPPGAPTSHVVNSTANLLNLAPGSFPLYKFFVLMRCCTISLDDLWSMRMKRARKLYSSPNGDRWSRISPPTRDEFHDRPSECLHPVSRLLAHSAIN